MTSQAPSLGNYLLSEEFHCFPKEIICSSESNICVSNDHICSPKGIDNCVSKDTIFPGKDSSFCERNIWFPRRNYKPQGRGYRLLGPVYGAFCNSECTNPLSANTDVLSNASHWCFSFLFFFFLVDTSLIIRSPRIFKISEKSLLKTTLHIRYKLYPWLQMRNIKITQSSRGVEHIEMK